MTKFFLALLAIAACAVLLAPEAVAQSTTVTGRWHFVFQTEGGERTFDATFEQQGEKVGGKWGDAKVAGTFANGKLDLEFPYNSEEAGPGTLKLKGELNSDVLTGTWNFQEYSGAFKATRIPASAS